MEQGGYAPDANNQLKRLNEVTRKWEQRLAREAQTNSSPPRDHSPPKSKRQRLSSGSIVPPLPPKLERQDAEEFK
jgi:mRNA-degrading endonuclease RelE of RelBE toxin-antitoxin system